MRREGHAGQRPQAEQRHSRVEHCAVCRELQAVRCSLNVSVQAGPQMKTLFAGLLSLNFQ